MSLVLYEDLPTFLYQILHFLPSGKHLQDKARHYLCVTLPGKIFDLPSPEAEDLARTQKVPILDMLVENSTSVKGV